MDTAAIFAKTPKGAEELRTRAHGLGLRARALLILVDGVATAGQIIDKGKASGNAAAYAGLEELLALGFIAPVAPAAGAAAGGSIEDARRLAVREMLDTLGPSADPFTARLEAAPDRQALYVELERCRQAIAGARGAARAERFWNAIRVPLEGASNKPAAPAPATGRPARSIAGLRDYAVGVMAALPGPHGIAFAERLRSAADRNTLVGILERCRTAVKLAAGDAEAERFWAGVEQRLPPP